MAQSVCAACLQLPADRNFLIMKIMLSGMNAAREALWS